MQKRTIILGDYDTAAHGWTLAPGWALSPAKYRQNFVEVPGMDGPLDLSTVLGGRPVYDTRTLTATLECSEGTRLEREALIDDMVNRLTGQRMAIVLPDDPLHHITGRVEVAKNYNDPAHAAVTVTAICGPWREAMEETSEVVDLTAPGQNLLANTRSLSGYYRAGTNSVAADADGFAVVEWASNSGETYRNVKPLPNLPFSPLRGRTVTVSFDVRSDDHKEINAEASKGLLVSFALYPDAATPTRAKYKDVNLYATELTNTWQRVSVTATLTDDYFYYTANPNMGTAFFNVIIFNTTAYHMQIRKPKLELGAAATDWAPAPADGEAAPTVVTRTVTLTNDTRPACPVVECIGGNTITFDGSTYSVDTGAYKLPGLQLRPGDNAVRVSGTGAVAFTYRKAVL